MTATRAVPAGRSVPAGRPRTTRTHDAEASRAELRVVRAAPPRRAGLAALGLVLVFGVLMAVAALNTVLVSGQRELDRIQRDIDDGHRRNEDLYLARAELSDPSRIVAVAERDGMIRPDETTMITVRPDGGTDVQVNATSEPDDPSDEGTSDTDERADGAAGRP